MFQENICVKTNKKSKMKIKYKILNFCWFHGNQMFKPDQLNL